MCTELEPWIRLISVYDRNHDSQVLIPEDIGRQETGVSWLDASYSEMR